MKDSITFVSYSFCLSSQCFWFLLLECKLTRVTSHKHLGITLSQDMRWNAHIDQITKKAGKPLNGIRRIRYLIDRNARETLYKALVLPILEYGNVLFDNCTLYLKQRLKIFKGKQPLYVLALLGLPPTTNY